MMVTAPITATTFLKGYLPFLREEGWDVTLVCPPDESVAAMAQEAGVGYVSLSMQRDPSPLKDAISLLKTMKLLRRLKPDVLVYATPKASLLGAIAGSVTRVPRRVYELWGLRLETAAGLSRRVLSALESLTIRMSSEVIANSRSLADRAIELDLAKSSKIRVLGAGSSHGVDATRFSRNSPMPVADSKTLTAISSSEGGVIGYVGRLHPDKGIDVLLDALAQFAHDNIPVQLLVVGDNEGAEVERLTASTEGTVSVHMVGYVYDPRPYMRLMDVLVLPSRREGFPNVVLEAASMEVPAVVSNATGCVDSVIDGTTGVVVPIDDSEALSKALMEILMDDPRRKAMGISARSRVVEEFVPADVWRAHSERWRA